MVDLEALLAPVSEAAPCGEDLSFSPQFDQIQDARRFDDPSLEQGEWVADLKTADWPLVVNRCSELLRTRSKDVRLAVWLTEALAKTDGFVGLGAGYNLLAQVCERYWDGVHPLAEDGDQEQRIGNFGWLLSRSAQLLREIPLTAGPGAAYFGLAAIDAARTRAARAGEGEGDAADALARIERARRETPREFYVALLESTGTCAIALKAFEQALDARLGTSGPAFGDAREALEAVTLQVRRYAKDAGILGADEVAESGAGEGGAASVGSASGVTGELQTRAQALAQLRRVADFFRRTEPHSPVAYLADKAALWGDMPLHVWLKTVIKDAGSLSHVEELLGLAQREPPAES